MGDSFRRLPDSVAKATNEGVFELCTNTAGGRVRFVTDSPYVAIKIRLGKTHSSAKMASTGTTGFDMYSRYEDGRDRFVNAFFATVRV